MEKGYFCLQFPFLVVVIYGAGAKGKYSGATVWSGTGQTCCYPLRMASERCGFLLLTDEPKSKVLIKNYPRQDKT